MSLISNGNKAFLLSSHRLHQSVFILLDCYQSNIGLSDKALDYEIATFLQRLHNNSKVFEALRSELKPELSLKLGQVFHSSNSQSNIYSSSPGGVAPIHDVLYRNIH